MPPPYCLFHWQPQNRILPLPLTFGRISWVLMNMSTITLLQPTNVTRLREWMIIKIPALVATNSNEFYFSRRQKVSYISSISYSTYLISSTLISDSLKVSSLKNRDLFTLSQNWFMILIEYVSIDWLWNWFLILHLESNCYLKLHMMFTLLLNLMLILTC